MKTASCKAKGRNFQNQISSDVRTTFNLPDPDAVGTAMGQSGIDVKLSAAARAVFPYATECKKQETTAIWKWIEQAEENAKKEKLNPLLVFSRNRSRSYAVIPWEHFLELSKIAAEKKE